MNTGYEIDDFTTVEVMVSLEMIERIDRVLSAHPILRSENLQSFTHRCLRYVVTQLEDESKDNDHPISEGYGI